MTENRSTVCHCIHKAWIGQRMLWLHCLLGANHVSKHWDLKRNFQWDGPVVYWDDYEQSTEKENRKRVSRRCPKCKLVPCCCSQQAQDRVGQSDMFRENPLYLEELIFGQMVDEYARRQQEEMDGTAYYGEF